ncbi:hypothetical protein GIB67_032346, partial [Kingdonia uniflora]
RERESPIKLLYRGSGDLKSKIQRFFFESKWRQWRWILDMYAQDSSSNHSELISRGVDC